MSLLTTVSVVGPISVDADALVARLDEAWGIRVDAPLAVCRGGLVNLVVEARSGARRYAVRVSRSADPVAEARRAALGGMAPPPLPLTRPLPSRLGGWSAPLDARVVSVAGWVDGGAPARTPAAAWRVGRAVGLLGRALAPLDAALPEGRFARLAREADGWLADATDPAAAETRALYRPPVDPSAWGATPSHTDIFGANLADDGERVGVLDFDELGLDDPAVDRLAYLAWEAFSPEEGFRPDLCDAYLRGLRAADPTPLPAAAVEWLVFLNVAENVFNLGLRRSDPRHVYPHYAANLRRARLVLAHRDELARHLFDPPDGP